MVVLLALGLGLTVGCDDDDDDGGNHEVRSANDGPEGFLWKPISESNGRLVILLPNEFRGRVRGVAIHAGDPPNAGNKIEDGTFAGDTHNGRRPHFRFSRSGGGYGQNIFAVGYFADGTISWPIPNGASRWD